MAASDELELVNMVRTAAEFDEGPISFRYPRGDGRGIELPERGTLLKIGRGKVCREGTKVSILSFGAHLQEAFSAADELDQMGISTTVADARFAKPLDTKLIKQLAENHEVLITIEEGSIGGFGSHVAHWLLNNQLLEKGLKYRSLFLADRFIDQASPSVMYKEAGLDISSIVGTALDALGIADVRSESIKLIK
jgi:1-deoxy-D-xylulose-5-phosphate synthase